MPKLKPEEIEQRRLEIIEAARRCFIRSGFHQTTTDEICREASITPGGLYHYFANKEDLIKAVIRYATDEALRTMAAMSAQNPNPRGALRSLGEFFFQAFSEPDFESIARLDLETWSEGLRAPNLLAIIQEGRDAIRTALVGMITDAVRRGDYSEKVDPHAFADVLMAIYTGLRIGRLLNPHQLDGIAALNAMRLMIQGEMVPSRPQPLPEAIPAEPELPRAAAGGQ